MPDTVDVKEPFATVAVVPVSVSGTSGSSSSDASDAEGDFSALAIDENFTPLPAYKAAGTTEIDFDGLLPAGRPLRLREDLKNGCGGQLWPAGMTLARYMLRHHATDLAGKRM
jgi:protein N-lysine methyltransferase METTL21A